MRILKKSEGEITITVKNNLANYYSNLLYNKLLNSTVICDKYKFEYPTGEFYLQIHSFYTFIPEFNKLQFQLDAEDGFQRTKFTINSGGINNPKEGVYFDNITNNFSVDYLIALNGSNNVDLVANMFGTSYTALIWNILSNTNGGKQVVHFNNVTLNSIQNYEALVIHALPRYRISDNNQTAITFAPIKFFGDSELNDSANLTLKYLVNISNSSFTEKQFIKFYVYETLILCSCDEKNGDSYKILTTKIIDPNTSYQNSAKCS
jgi:hypothetical protein